MSAAGNDESKIHPTPPDVRREIVDTVKRFVEREVEPQASDYDHRNEYPHTMVATMKELGLFGATIPTGWGGLGLDTLTYAMIVEEICVGWMSLSGILNTHLLLAYIIRNFGSDEQRDAIRRITYNMDTDEILSHYVFYCAMCPTLHEPIVAPILLEIDVEARIGRGEVPGVVGAPEGEAYATIMAANLNVGTVTAEFSATEPAGLVEAATGGRAQEMRSRCDVQRQRLRSRRRHPGRVPSPGESVLTVGVPEARSGSRNRPVLLPLAGLSARGRAGRPAAGGASPEV